MPSTRATSAPSVSVASSRTLASTSPKSVVGSQGAATVSATTAAISRLFTAV